MTETARIWLQSSVLEYLLIWIVIVVFLIFIIPREDVDWSLAYVASILSYGIVIAFIYYWSIKTSYENRDMRIVFIVFIFVMVFAQVFHYYTTNDSIALITFIIAIILLLYLIIRGIRSVFVIMMLIPLALISYYIAIQIIS